MLLALPLAMPLTIGQSPQNLGILDPEEGFRKLESIKRKGQIRQLYGLKSTEVAISLDTLLKLSSMKCIG